MKPAYDMHRKTPSILPYILRIAVLPMLLFSVACQQSQTATGNNVVEPSDSVVRSCILSAAWDERAPFHYRVTDGSVFGVDIDILANITKKSGCAIRYRKISKEQQLERLASGDVDMVIGVYRSADSAAQNLVYSDVYREENYDLHVISGSPVHREELGMLIKLDFDLGLTAGHHYDEPITTLRQDILHKRQFVVAADARDNIANLLGGNVDGILEDPLVVMAIADQQLVENQIEHLEVNGGSQDVYFIFNREKVSADIIDRFNSAIASMKREGDYQQIVARHTR